jgi:hypothetical protein
MMLMMTAGVMSRAWHHMEYRISESSHEAGYRMASGVLDIEH